jgi:hypothetical protein
MSNPDADGTGTTGMITKRITILYDPLIRSAKNGYFFWYNACKLFLLLE